ncbi:LysR family transcriptional regulator [Stenotrophomonas sp. MMGLT7]|uniref:LysR family transcriptional regulator n=1 Tax=Stenotrophomonas sp. MMGLT7 TaxID=2901227 RepID=UPI001E42B6AD|nr:LysR family transcriptional regulator [Stenotrophomonas sp. MMGLT7]MCD7099516.1 LysR family transcriptional regulator [Stenotrophomonas sp. MMGLT7]
MDIRQLKALVEVVRRGGFSAAAESLNATQPTVSKTVKLLEDEVGLPLLERSRQGVRLTQAGEIVYRRALTLLAERDSLEAELDDLRGLRRGELHVGLPLLGSDILFAPLFAAYRERYPGVQLRLLELGSQALEDSLRSGDVELAGSLLPADDEFEWQSVRREPMVVVMPPGHPLAGRDSVGLDALKDSAFILFEKGFALNRRIVAACQRHGFTPREAARSGQISFIAALVAAGIGVAVLPRMIAQRHVHGLPMALLDEHDLVWHMALIWRRGSFLSRAAQAWLQLASEHRRG